MRSLAVSLAIAFALLSSAAARADEMGAGIGVGGFVPLSGLFSDVYGPGIAAHLRTIRGRDRLRFFGELSVLVDDGFGRIGYDLAGGNSPETYLTTLSGVIASAHFVEAHNRGTPVAGVGWYQMQARIVLVPMRLGAAWRLVDSLSMRGEMFGALGPVVGMESVSGSYQDNLEQPSFVSDEVSLAGFEASLGLRITIPIKSHWHIALDLGGSLGSASAPGTRGSVGTSRVELRAGFSYEPPPPTPTPRLQEALTPTPTVVPLSGGTAPPVPTPTAGPK